MSEPSFQLIRTAVIQKHRINAYDEITAMVVMTLQVPTNHVVRYGKKTLVETFGTFDPWLFADALDPFITTHRCIAGPTSLPAFEATRVNIFASVKQRTEEGDFDLGR
jgi:hypothetical protein